MKFAWEVMSDNGYATDWQTGATCAMPGCTGDAGTGWFEDLCPVCTREKLRRERASSKKKGYRPRVYADK